jgi:hypothetical protein
MFSTINRPIAVTGCRFILMTRVPRVNTCGGGAGWQVIGDCVEKPLQNHASAGGLIYN